MGILELHLHEPAFNVSTGSDAGTEGLRKATEMMGTGTGHAGDRETEEAEEGGGGGAKGALLALVALVVAAVVVRRMRGGGDAGYEPEGREEFAEVE